MALEVETLSFTSPSSTGSQTISMSGSWTPKAAIVIYSHRTATGEGVNNVIGIGITDGTTDRAVCIAGDDDEGTTDTDRRHAAQFITLLTTTTGAVKEEATHVSFGAGQVVITWGTIASAALNYGLLLLGGDDLEGVDVTEFTFPGSTGTQTYNAGNVDCSSGNAAVVLLTVQSSSAVSATSAGGQIGVGLMTSNGEGMVCVSSQNSVSTSNTSSYERSDKCLSAINYGGTLIQEGEFSKWENGASNSWEINWTTSSNSTQIFFALTLAGMKASVINGTSPTSTGNKNYTGSPFMGRQSLSLSDGVAATSSIHDESHISIGFDDGSTRLAVTGTDEHGESDSNCNRNWQGAQSLFQASQTDATVLASSTVKSFETHGLVRNWGTVDSTARQFVELILGDESANYRMRGRSLPGEMRCRRETVIFPWTA